MAGYDGMVEKEKDSFLTAILGKGKVSPDTVKPAIRDFFISVWALQRETSELVRKFRRTDLDLRTYYDLASATEAFSETDFTLIADVQNRLNEIEELLTPDAFKQLLPYLMGELEFKLERGKLLSNKPKLIKSSAEVIRSSNNNRQILNDLFTDYFRYFKSLNQNLERMGKLINPGDEEDADYEKIQTTAIRNLPLWNTIFQTNFRKAIGEDKFESLERDTAFAT